MVEERVEVAEGKFFVITYRGSFMTPERVQWSLVLKRDNGLTTELAVGSLYSLEDANALCSVLMLDHQELPYVYNVGQLLRRLFQFGVSAFADIRDCQYDAG